MSIKNDFKEYSMQEKNSKLTKIQFNSNSNLLLQNAIYTFCNLYYDFLDLITEF